MGDPAVSVTPCFINIWHIPGKIAGQRKLTLPGGFVILPELPAMACGRPGHCNETQPAVLFTANGAAGDPTVVAEPHLDESALVDRARTDPEAFGMLYERYVKRIYNYVYFRTGSHEDAEDLTSHVFQRAVQRLSTYTDRGLPFVAWLYRIAHNVVANWYRDQGRRRTVPLDSAPSRVRVEGPEHLVETNAERDQVLTALRKLTAERQQLLILKFIDQMSNAEIGQVLNRSESAIKSLYHRTLEELRADLVGVMTEITLQPEIAALNGQAIR